MLVKNDNPYAKIIRQAVKESGLLAYQMKAHNLTLGTGTRRSGDDRTGSSSW